MTEDLYPSRVAREPAYLPRLDPVIHGDATPNFALSAEQASAYEDDGFMIVENVFSADEVDFILAEAARLRDIGDELEDETLIIEPGSGAIRSIFKTHMQSDIFYRLASDTRLACIAQHILGDDVYIHQSRLNNKPGFDGKEFHWHSDFETWHVEDGMPRMRAVSMSVLLNDNLPFNGPTMFVKGSHKRFVSCVGETPEDHYKESLIRQEFGVPDRRILTELCENGLAMPTGNAGSVVIFDCNTMHGSNSNITPLPRSNAFFVFNSVTNKLQAPFGPDKPRPEFIAARQNTQPIEPVAGDLVKIAA